MLVMSPDALNAGTRGALGQPHRIELVPAGRGDDPARERHAHDLRPEFRQPRDAAAASARGACSRSRGTRSDIRASRAPACRRSGRRPWACLVSRATPWNDDLAAAISTSMIRSCSPTELPPEKTSTSCASAASTAADQRLERVVRRQAAPPARRRVTPTIDDSVKRLMS